MKAKKKTSKKVVKKAVKKPALKGVKKAKATNKMKNARDVITKAIESTGSKQYIVAALFEDKIYFGINSSYEFMTQVFNTLNDTLNDKGASCLQ